MIIVAGTGKIKSTVGILAWEIKNNRKYLAHSKIKEFSGRLQSKIVICLYCYFYNVILKLH